MLELLSLSERLTLVSRLFERAKTGMGLERLLLNALFESYKAPCILTDFFTMLTGSIASAIRLFLLPLSRRLIIMQELIKPCLRLILHLFILQV